MMDASKINVLELPSVFLYQRCKLPKEPCIYFAINSTGQIQYIGKSINPKQRWSSHHKYQELSSQPEIRIAYLVCDRDLLNEVESALISWFNPPLNKSTSQGRQVGFSPINGAGGTMTKKQKAWSMPDEHWQWLESQPNQSEVLRELIQARRQNS